jgi:hypothetical protein
VGDCFVLGIPIEVDFLVTRRGAKATWGLLYSPDDVRVALEVKQLGAFPSTIKKVRRNFRHLSVHCPRLACAYVAIKERKGYKLAVTKAKIGYPAFALAVYRHPAKEFELTGGWERLLAFLRQTLNS